MADLTRKTKTEMEEISRNAAMIARGYDLFVRPAGKMTSSDRNVILFQAIRALLSDIPQTNEVTRARKGLDIAIEELTMEEE